jgi:hypothetical protein
MVMLVYVVSFPEEIDTARLVLSQRIKGGGVKESVESSGILAGRSARQGVESRVGRLAARSLSTTQERNRAEKPEATARWRNDVTELEGGDGGGVNLTF